MIVMIYVLEREFFEVDYYVSYIESRRFYRKSKIV